MTAETSVSRPASDPDAGVAELAALTAFCRASDDDVLALPEHELWASARLLDGLAVLAHGHRTKVSAVVRSVFRPGPGAAHLWPDTSGSYRADDAAYVLGVAAFSENYADTGLGSVAHINSIVVPALLIAMQRRQITGREALAALVVGYEVMEWAGATLNGGRPRMAHQLRGFRPTPSAGPLSAVAVLGRLMGLSGDDMMNALSLACSQGGGLRPSTASATSAIRLQSGEALRRSVNSVDLATAGIAGHPGMLRVSGGYFPAYGTGELGRYDVPVAGAPGLLTKISMKLDCTPHTLVTMLDATRALHGRRPHTAADITAVTVRIPRQHNVISGGDKPYPTTFSQAAGHVPYCIALALLTGSYLLPDVIERGLTDEDVRAVAGRVSLVVDDRLSIIFDDDPMSWPAEVRVDRADGGTDSVDMRAPETSDWSATEAMRHAATKAVGLLGEPAGDATALGELFGTVAQWPDIWQRLREDPFPRWTGGVDGG